MAGIRQSHYKEYKTAITATLIMISAGNAIGWTSPTLPLLLDPDSPIHITPDQSSWINSMMILSSIFSALPAAYVADRFGRKITMLLGAVPYILGWIMIIFAKTVYELYIARVLPGIGYGIIYTVAPMYLGEISSDAIRGSLAIMITFMNKFGILFQYCIGPYVSMKTLAGINLSIPIVFFFTFMWMAESPYYYVKEGRFDDAEKSLKKLRCNHNVIEERNKIEATVTEDMKNRGQVLDLFTDPINRKALITNLVLFGTQQFCGSAAVVSYAQTIFKNAEGNINASSASIILGCVQLMVAASAVFLVDRLGRRPLLLISSFGVFIMNIVIGTYFFYKDYLHYDVKSVGYLPVISIVAYIVLYTVGLSTVPLAVTSEMFPTTIKSSATSVLQIFVGLSTFTVTKLFQVIADNLGNYVVFWCFAFFSFFGLIYIYFQLPETKGKSFAVIQNQLRHNNDSIDDDDQCC